jgi:hypothetical protein
LLYIKRDLRHQESRWRVKHSGEFKTKYAADDAMEEDSAIRSLHDAKDDLEAEVELIGAVCDGFMAIRDAASREIERRKAERAQA